MQRSSPGWLASLLMAAAGVLTLVNNVLPGDGNLDFPVLYVTGAVALLLGAVGLLVPWDRLPARSPYLLVLAALALIALSDSYGGISHFPYAVYFVVVFVWVGVTQPPGSALALSPLALAAYLLPLVLNTSAPQQASTASVAIPVCVLVGEMLSRGVRRQRRSHEELQARVRVVERMAELAAQIGRELEPIAVGQALVDCAAEIFAGRAVFGRVEGDDLVNVAVQGLPADRLGQRVPLRRTSVWRAAATELLVTATDASGTTLPVPAGGCVLTVACRSGAELLGGLSVVLDQPADEVSDESHHVLSLIGVQGEIALLNAEAHTALLAERRHEQAVVDLLGDGVLVATADGQVCSCNRAAEQLLAADRDQLVGRPLTAVLGGRSGAQQVPSGRWIETVTAELPDTAETVVTLRDITRQHELDEAKDLFLATTSHELRTPLTAIKGYVSTLQRHWSRLDESDRRRALAVVDEQAEGLIRLTDHLLLGARAGRSEAPRASFDVAKVVTGVAAAYSKVSPVHSIRAKVPLNGTVAVGDESSTRSLLGQLVENAVKYSPSGGEVEIEVSRVENRVVVDVLDRGVGLPPEKVEALFTPFYQAEPANTRSFGGVGLGLFIVRRLVEGQGGGVSAHQRPGGGADFQFWLPAAPLAVHRDCEPAAAEG